MAALSMLLCYSIACQGQSPKPSVSKYPTSDRGEMFSPVLDVVNEQAKIILECRFFLVMETDALIE